MNPYKLLLPLIFMAASGLSVPAHAIPWCQGGTIVTLHTHVLDETALLYHFGNQTIPPNVDPVDEDRYIASTVAWGLAYPHAGGGGGWGGWSVPNAGEVEADVFAPNSYVSQIIYSLSEGLGFDVKKCFTIPPMVQVEWDLDSVDNGGVGGANPLPYVKGIERFWESVPISPAKSTDR